jgi:S-adenosylmethionine:tRNA ribosyltransferase-isomerase
MRTEEFDYSLPRELIAQHPHEERSSSRLLVLSRHDERIEHRHFKDITDYLRENDLLVVNDTKVMPARITAKKATGGSVEILLTEKIDEKRWSCLVSGVKDRTGETELRAGAIPVRVKCGLPFWTVEFPDAADAERAMATCGTMPLPHYIKRGNGVESEDYERYQTVYASREGSIAAPTAGLHFDDDLMARITAMGVTIARVTLHIGVGTFFLIKSDRVEDHAMHGEHYTLTRETLHLIRETKSRGGRVIAVGTSAVRTLETACASGNGQSLSGCTTLFIYPGYVFTTVDALITNFHLPRSTPLMLVCAFAGKDAINGAYREAIDRQYRFYSYGDAMFIS